MNKTKKKIIIGLIIRSIFIFIIFEMILFNIASYNDQKESAKLYQKTYALQTQIESIFHSTNTISDGYLSYVSDNVNLTKEESEEFLSHLLSYDDIFVRNISLVEDTTIKYNYPYEENQTSIGVDLSTVEGQIEETLFVKNNQEPIFFGPVELVQGGMAFLLSIPVLDDGEYWGQVFVVIDMDVFTDTISQEAGIHKVDLKITDHSSKEVLLLLGDTNKDNVATTNYSSKYFSWDIEVTETNPVNTIVQDVFYRLFAVLILLIHGYFSLKTKMLNQELIYNGVHDFLTDDFNRSKFIKDYSEKKFENMLIAFTDVNKFKILNDTLGHLFGDWCLIQLSNKFKEFEDLRVYRISGDEFILVSKSQMSINDFEKLISSNKFIFYNEDLKQNIDLELSIGVLEELSPSINLESMLMYLDYAMYDAKKERKNFTVVTKELMNKYDETKIIEQQLIDDVKKNKLIPYYQPIINTETGKIDGFEVLSRWLYKGEIRTASTFINVIKKIKYVDLVDRNLFNKLQDEYHDLLKDCPQIDSMTFSINLSAESLMIIEKDNRKFDVFTKELSMPKENIIFEISEDMNLGLISIETLRYMQTKGYNVTVDDFGAGVSKLSDVLSGELKRIKTDKSLLPEKSTNDKKIDGFYTIIKAIQASGSTICAEGVETVSHLEMAIDAGCKLVQGYLFGMPMPKKDIIEFIKTFDYNEYTKK